MSTKSAIIQAATNLFAEKGYEGMTMKEIAKEVGIKAPSVYAFYESKEDIFLHIYQEVLKEHLELASSNVNQSEKKSVKEQLDELLQGVIEYQFKEAIKMKILIRILLFPPDFLEEDIKEKFLVVEKKEHEMLSEMFELGMKNGEIKNGDSGALAATMICLMDGIFWQMQRSDKETFNKRFEVIWRQFWKSIRSE